ncbi:MAG: AMP-binding protein [Parvularculaceae bacterium]
MTEPHPPASTTQKRPPSLEAGKVEAQEELAAIDRRKADALKTQARIKARSRTTLLSRLRAASRKHSDKPAIIEPEGREISYTDLLRGAYGLGSAFTKFSARGENVGILLPTSAGAVISFFALHAFGRVPAMLNFTAGRRNLSSALKTANISTIITAHKFIEQAGLEDLITTLAGKAKIVYLEDVKEKLTKFDKLRAVVGAKFPWLVSTGASHEAPGAILFTSGTEGEPKGVVLSQQNLVANVEQIRAHVRLEPNDIIFNPLPIFHCYGLTAGTLFPILDGKPLVPYPSPLHVKIVPEIVRRTGATIMFATDTFLHRYLRGAKEGALTTLRYAVCGAEHVRDETRALAKERFGFMVLEGYGVTEASPVLAANQPGDIRPGTVGKMLPGIEARLEPVAGLDQGGRLFVRGPNVMQGYLLADKPGQLTKLADGWHDTGDIVTIDGGGYISIRGRVKRFAKLGGEMVSLAVVENCAGVVWPDYLHAAVTLPDSKKGEQIILLTECPDPERTLLLSWAQSHGVPELAVPKKLISVDAIPILGTGKVDYLSLTELAKDALLAKDA